jgi:hypothetical protein
MILIILDQELLQLVEELIFLMKMMMIMNIFKVRLMKLEFGLLLELKLKFKHLIEQQLIRSIQI